MDKIRDSDAAKAKKGQGSSNRSKAKRLIVFSSVLLFALVFLSPVVSSSMPLAQAQQNTTGVYVPLYIYPDTSNWNGEWQRLMRAQLAHPDVPFLVTVNPNSGPGSSFSQAYYQGISSLDAAGVTVIGYIPTGYGRESPQDTWTNIVYKLDDCSPSDYRCINLFDMVDRYAEWYPHVEGIMIDELGSDYEWYSRLVTYARAQGLDFIRANPGTGISDGRFASLFDNIAIYEGSGYPDVSVIASRTSQGGGAGYSATVHSVTQLDIQWLERASPYLDYTYVATGFGRNPYDSISGRINQLAAQLDRINGGSGVPGEVPELPSPPEPPPPPPEVEGGGEEPERPPEQGPIAEIPSLIEPREIPDAVLLDDADCRDRARETDNELFAIVCFTIEALPDDSGFPAINSDGTHYPGDAVMIRYVFLGRLLTVDPDDRRWLQASLNVNSTGPLRVIDQGPNERQDRSGYFVVASTSSPSMEHYLESPHQMSLSVTVGTEMTGAQLQRTQTYSYTLVPYQPQTDQFFYPILADGHVRPYMDRMAHLVAYRGSMGNYPGDLTIYPDRRFVAYHEFNATVYAMELQETETGFTSSLTGEPAPPIFSGVREQAYDDLIEVVPQNTTAVYLPGAAYYKEIYRFELTGEGEEHAEFAGDSIMENAHKLNATIHTWWLPAAYEEYDSYRIPMPERNVAFSGGGLEVHVLPEQSVEVSVFPLRTLDPEQFVTDDHIKTSLQQYAYEKVYAMFGDEEMGRIVASDMPLTFSSQAPDGKVLIEDVSKNSIDTTIWSLMFSQANLQTMNLDPGTWGAFAPPEYEFSSGQGTEPPVFLDLDFSDVYEGSMSPFVLVIERDAAPEEQIIRVIDDVDFYQTDPIVIDLTERDGGLEFRHRPGATSFVVLSPWEVQSMSFSGPASDTASIRSCTDIRDPVTDLYPCFVRYEALLHQGEKAPPIRVVAVNEFGGSASGTMTPNIDLPGPIPEDVKDRFVQAVAIIGIAGATIAVLPRLLRRLFPENSQ